MNSIALTTPWVSNISLNSSRRLLDSDEISFVKTGIRVMENTVDPNIHIVAIELLMNIVSTEKELEPIELSTKVNSIVDLSECEVEIDDSDANDDEDNELRYIYLKIAPRVYDATRGLVYNITSSMGKGLMLQAVDFDRMYKNQQQTEGEEEEQPDQFAIGENNGRQDNEGAGLGWTKVIEMLRENGIPDLEQIDFMDSVAYQSHYRFLPELKFAYPQNAEFDRQTNDIMGQLLLGSSEITVLPILKNDVVNLRITDSDGDVYMWSECSEDDQIRFSYMLINEYNQKCKIYQEAGINLDRCQKLPSHVLPDRDDYLALFRNPDFRTKYGAQWFPPIFFAHMDTEC